MPDLALHFGVALLINMIVCFKRDKRNWLWVLILSPLSVYHDLDILWGHRMILHSFVIQAIIVLLVWILTKRNNLITLIIAVNVFSHILMDMSQFYVACFWPFTDGVFSFHFDIFVNMDTPSVLDSNISGEFQPDFPTSSLEQWGTLFSTLGIIISLVAGILWGVIYRNLLERDKKEEIDKENILEVDSDET